MSKNGDIINIYDFNEFDKLTDDELKKVALLKFEEVNLTDEGWKEFAGKLSKAWRLKFIFLENCNMGDELVKIIINAIDQELGKEWTSNKSTTEVKVVKKFNNLGFIEFHGNNITDEGAKEISKLIKKLPNLLYLGFRKNNITNEGAEEICSACTNNEITIDFRNNKIKDEAHLANSFSNIAIHSKSQQPNKDDKNIIAIKTGIMMAKGEGENAKASYIAKGLQEAWLIAQKLGGKSETILNPAITGDLILTSYSISSRNTKFGYEFYKNNYATEFLQNYPILVEGVEAAKLIKEIIELDKSKFPVITSVTDLI